MYRIGFLPQTGSAYYLPPSRLGGAGSRSMVGVCASGFQRGGLQISNVHTAKQIVRPEEDKKSQISNLIHPFDVGTLLDQQGVAVRTGHHCAEPLIDALGVPGTVRVSFGLYNDKHDVDAFITALQKR